MRASSLIIPAFAILATVTSASAQSVGIYVGPSTYGYSYDDDAVQVATPRARIYADEPRVEIRPSSCGTYRFWNGEFCEDARDR